MKLRTLGKTGLQVSELGLGTYFMSGQGQGEVNRCIHYAIDQGVNYFDTAADYGKGQDEEMLGLALQGKRNQVVLATKVGYTPDPKGHRNPKLLMEQFEGSLRRLQTDRVDIIQVHEADFRKWWTDEPITAQEGLDHFGEVIRDEEEYDFDGAPIHEFLREAIRSGKTKYVGITGKNARLMARILPHLQIDSMMIAHQLNPIYRNAAEYLIPQVKSRNLGLVNGAPFMKGWLAEPQHQWKQQPPEWMDETFANAYFRYVEIVEGAGLNLAEATIRWLLSIEQQHSIVSGFTQIAEITKNIEAVNKGVLPRDVQESIDHIGIIHPLIYQNRNEL